MGILVTFLQEVIPVSPVSLCCLQNHFKAINVDKTEIQDIFSSLLTLSA